LRLIAHRGGRGFGTDNTLEAMEAAVRAGVRAIETDVRTTADGELVICHDAMVSGRLVARMTSGELKNIDPARPLLSEVLESLAGWVTFNIEVKDASPDALAEMLATYAIYGDTLVTSFNEEFLGGLKALHKEVRTGHLYWLSYGEKKKLEETVEMGAEVVLPHFGGITAETIVDAHGFGLEVWAWTVNDEKDFEKLRGWGVDGVITDRYLEMEQVGSGLES
jgi:glycerophosphoryl diester phosphodiesterase